MLRAVHDLTWNSLDSYNCINYLICANNYCNPDWQIGSTAPRVIKYVLQSILSNIQSHNFEVSLKANGNG